MGRNGDILSEKQRIFVEEYKKDFNATQAAERAGYKNPSVSGNLNLKKKVVKKEIDKARNKQLKRIKLEADEILEEILAIASADITAAYNSDGTLKPIEKWPENVKKSLSGISRSESVGSESQSLSMNVKFHPKLKALELLAKHLKLLTDRVEIDTTDELAKRLADARQNLNK